MKIEIKEELINYWTDVIKNKNSSFISSNDEQLFIENNRADLLLRYSYEEILSDREKFQQKGFHINLLPAPYSGDLSNADIFILLANPGYSLTDYYDESCKDYRDAVIKNIKQEQVEYANPCFNPAFLWTGGARYWNGKLKDIVQQLLDTGVYNSYADILKAFSNRIATLELVPYHSEYLNPPRRIFDSLESKKLMLTFIKEYVLPKARAGKALVVVGRRADDWGIEDDRENNIIVYPHKQAQSFSLTSQSCGGSAIINWLAESKK